MYLGTLVRVVDRIPLLIQERLGVVACNSSRKN
jgi:hypothetical protein